MATAELVIMVCGGNYSLSDTPKYLGYEHDDGLALAITNILDRSIIQEMADKFLEMAKAFNSVLVKFLQCRLPIPVKWYNPIDLHSYRKIHRITPRRVVKRRDRQSRGSVRLLKVESVEDEEE